MNLLWGDMMGTGFIQLERNFGWVGELQLLEEDFALLNQSWTGDAE